MEQQSFVKKWGSLVILSLALAIIIIDTTLLNVSLGNIIREFQTDIQSLQWVITGYTLTLAALTVTGGRLGDIFGKKKMFMLGAIIFGIGSLVASFSNSVRVLFIGEALIEGVGAALMMPATSSLLITNFRGRDRAIAFGVWGAIAGAASAVGPILGGFLTSQYSWRWGFRINVAVVILLLIGSVLVKESRDKVIKTGLDWGGVLLSATGLTSFVFGIIESSRYGWFKQKEVFVAGNYTLQLPFDLSVVPVAIILGLIILALFILWERYIEAKGSVPIVSMKLLNNHQFTSGVLTTAVLSLGQSGIIFSVPIFLQSVKGLDAFQTGIALLPLSLALLVCAPLSAVMSKKLKPKTVIQLGMFLNIVAALVLRQSFSIEAGPWNLAPGLLLYGAGFGLVISLISNMTLSAVSSEEAGEASGVNNTLRQVGASLGSAIIGAVLLSTLATSLSSGIAQSKVIPEDMKQVISANVASQTSNVGFGGGAQLSRSIPASIQQELKQISNQATVDANKQALLYGALFALLGFVVSFGLPNKTNLDRSHATSVSSQEEISQTPAQPNSRVQHQKSVQTKNLKSSSRRFDI